LLVACHSMNNGERIYSKKRQTVHVTLWVSPSEKAELERLAQQEGLSVSQTGRTILVDGLRQRLRIEREVLAQPILEQTIHKEISRLIGKLSLLLGQGMFEAGQMRRLFVNHLYRNVTHAEQKLTKEAFYELLDTCREETIKNMFSRTRHNSEVVAAIAKWLREEQH
jgi:hypothetical protein